MNTIENQTVLSYEDVIVDRSQLNPGRIVEVRKPQTVDDFFHHVAGIIRGEPVTYIQKVNNGIGCSKKNFYRDTESVIKDRVKLVIKDGGEIEVRERTVRRHNGGLGGSTIVILRDNNSWISAISKSVSIQRKDLGPLTGVNFLIATEMFTSSQRSSIGLVLNEALLCFDKKGEEYWLEIGDPNRKEIPGYIDFWV